MVMSNTLFEYFIKKEGCPMKKRFALIVAIAVFLQLPSALIHSSCIAETNLNKFDPTLTAGISFTAQDWFASSLNRGLVATLIGMDFSESQNSIEENNRLEIDWNSGAYVAKAKDSTTLLCVLYRLTNNQIIMINYLSYNEGSAWFSLMGKDIKNPGSFKFYAENILRLYSYQYYAITYEQIVESREIANDLVEE